MKLISVIALIWILALAGAAIARGPCNVKNGYVTTGGGLYGACGPTVQSTDTPTPTQTPTQTPTPTPVPSPTPT